jgi:hypothetical protein
MVYLSISRSLRSNGSTRYTVEDNSRIHEDNFERKKKNNEKAVEVDAESECSSIPVDVIYRIRKHSIWQLTTHYDLKLQNCT